MTLRHSSWSKVGAAIAVVAAVALMIGVAQASNMGFKMNRVIQPVGTPNPKGHNLVGLPYKNPYNNAQDVCAALGLSNVVPQGKIIQVNASSGAQASHSCGDANPFALTPRVGMDITNNTLAGGILVGSHNANPPGSITIFAKGTPSPKGSNYFPVPWHTTAVNAQDLCVDLTLPATTNVKGVVPSTGAQPSHNCGDAGPFALVLGDTYIITLPTGALTVNVPAGHPAHF